MTSKNSRLSSDDNHLLGPECRGVVGAHLCETAAARPSPHVAGVTQKVDRLEARGVVRTYGAEQHEQPGVLGRGHPQGGLRTDHGRSDVERGGGVVRDPGRVNNNQSETGQKVS